MSGNVDVSLQINERLDKYERALQALAQLPSAVSSYQRLLDVMVCRDSVQELVTNNTTAAVNAIERIVKLDRQLKLQVKSLLLRGKIISESWSAVLPEKSGWWWQIDNTQIYDLQSPVSHLWGGISLLLLIVSFLIILLRTQHLWKNGLEALSGAALVVQVLIGGGFITEQGRVFANRLLSSSRFFRRIGTASLLAAAQLFFILTLIINAVALPALATLMHEQGLTAMRQRNVGDAESFLNIAYGLDSRYTGSLVQLGILLEEMGDTDSAKSYFEQAVVADSHQVIGLYRLAELYADEGSTQHAIDLLSFGLKTLDDYFGGGIELPLASEAEGVQIQYLLLVSRGRAFVLSDQPEAALIDLDTAHQIATDHPELFITSDNKTAPPENAYYTTELYVRQAEAYELIFDLSGDERFRELADESWREVQLLASADDPRERIWLLQASAHLRS